jgi:hypothetical protein
MKGKIYLFGLILITGLFLPGKLSASHMMGSDLTWTCIGKDSFLIKLVIYRDCNGVPLSAMPLTFKCVTTGATITSTSVSPGAGTDITPVCNTSCTRCQVPAVHSLMVFNGLL